MWGISWLAAKPVSFSRRTLLHGVSKYLKNGMILEGKKLLNIKMSVLTSLQFLSEAFLIPRRIERDIIINVRRVHVKCPLFVAEFNGTVLFSTDFQKKKILKYQTSRKSVQWKPSWSSMRTDGRTDKQTDTMNLTVAFRNSAKESKKRRTGKMQVQPSTQCLLDTTSN